MGKVKVFSALKFWQLIDHRHLTKFLWKKIYTCSFQCCDLRLFLQNQCSVGWSSGCQIKRTMIKLTVRYLLLEFHQFFCQMLLVTSLCQASHHLRPHPDILIRHLHNKYNILWQLLPPVTLQTFLEHTVAIFPKIKYNRVTYEFMNIYYCNQS